MIVIVEELRQKVLNRLDASREISDQEVYDTIDEVLCEDKAVRYLPLKKREQFRKRIFDSLRGLDVLQELLEEDGVTEIMVNGYENIFIEKNGHLSKYEGQFITEERMQDVIQSIVAKSNRRVNEASPIVDARLEDGSRVNIILNPISLDGSVITIRRFPKERITMDKLIQIESVTKEVARFLEKLVVAGYNIFISGGTGSGKTTFLNALSNYIPKHERIITIEDSAELQIQDVPNLVRLEARQENTDGENGVSIRDLIRSSLRMRPRQNYRRGSKRRRSSRYATGHVHRA